MVFGKSMYCSEVHGGAGPGFRPASAHYIAEHFLSEIAALLLLQRCPLWDLFFIKTLHVTQSLNTCLSNRLSPCPLS